MRDRMELGDKAKKQMPEQREAKASNHESHSNNVITALSETRVADINVEKGC